MVLSLEHLTLHTVSILMTAEFLSPHRSHCKETLIPQQSCDVTLNRSEQQMNEEKPLVPTKRIDCCLGGR